MPLRPRVLPRLLLAAALLFPAGCRAEQGPPALSPPPPPDAPSSGQTSLMHWPVARPEPVTAARPVLAVALAARLGPAPSEAPAAPPLRLRGNGGLLTLIDASGQRFQAPSLVLHWRRELLPGPVTLRRRVLGPFASFESAEQAAGIWRSMGVAAVIARPRDWEVWAPAGAPDPAALPEGLRLQSLERTVSERVGLELRRAQGVVPLAGPIRIEAPGGLLWDRGVYAGPFQLLSDAHGGWSLVEQVPLERYLEGVVPHEIGAGVPAAALEAQAVLARTWAVRNQHRFAADGYHLCADTQCQVYSDPRQAGAAVRQAIAATRLAVLMGADGPIHAVYHASNGGISAAFQEAWNGPPVPYLNAFPDGPAPFQTRFPVPLAAAALPTLLRDGQAAWGADHPVFRWQRRLTAAQVAAALGPERGVGRPTALKVLARGPSGRVLALEVQGTKGRTVLRLDAIRRTLRSLPSTLFTLRPEGEGAWQLAGGGFGHGAGLSQAGAIDLAGRGWGARRILAHYYPGTSLQPLGAGADSP
ncbi:SpoIID/LytB domain-containing protein [Cyanobium gracile UHCC 0139]|uniref:SpoIID/LytB domain-containing protein n=1 Tax=Cyanobium gracile UHCC 0139 TaxID=3110308 RepID=A0ABU5RR42_9CYAN|nr:SpoIID/LytB domain-containing protein [Cyanobium gracile]MEA5390229.1 SpoIID/LytB domain-containing protein [Cyanobium gracile UHCC 0139]